jgi:hypothetical protein
VAPAQGAWGEEPWTRERASDAFLLIQGLLHVVLDAAIRDAGFRFPSGLLVLLKTPVFFKIKFQDSVIIEASLECMATALLSVSLEVHHAIPAPVPPFLPHASSEQQNGKRDT